MNTNNVTYSNSALTFTSQAFAELTETPEGWSDVGNGLQKIRTDGGTGFYQNKYNFLTEEILLEWAEKNECVIRSRGYDYECNPHCDALWVGEKISEDYAVKTINTRGMGNCGTDVIVGKSFHGKKRIGEIKTRILENYGIDKEIAKVAPFMPYGMELQVVKLAEDLLPILKLFRGRREFPKTPKEFYRLTNINFRTYMISFPRTQAAWNIAYKAIEVANRKY